jgi:hypothetical protein
MNTNGFASAETKSSTFLLVIGWISAIISLIKFPFIFGVLGVIMGILATKNGSKGGLPLIMASMILMAAGLFLNNIIFGYLRHLIGI